MIMEAFKEENFNGTRKHYEATSGNVGIAMTGLSLVFGLEFGSYIQKSELGGTSRHIAGIAKYLKEKYGTIIIGVVLAQGSTIPGTKRLETKPKWFFKVKVDEVVEITEEEAFKGVVKIARSDGLLIGNELRSSCCDL